MDNGRKDGNLYGDIIGLPHPVSVSHPPMSRHSRAAQFSPFAALNGYQEAIVETGRRTDRRRELEEDAREALDERLRRVQERAGERPEVEITYFLPDRKKSGGRYVSVRGCIKKADREGRALVMQDGTKIPLEEIVKIDD